MLRIALLACILPAVAYSQSFERNEFTFSGGYGWQADVQTGAPRLSAVSLGGQYSFRLRPWLALEGGVLTANNPTGLINSEYGYFNIHDRYTWVPFGARFVLPLRHDRFEISAGGGGVYERYTVGNTQAPTGPTPYSGWGGYFKANAAVALDPGRHLWLGTTPQWILVNAHSVRDRWFVLTGEIGFRF